MKLKKTRRLEDFVIEANGAVYGARLLTSPQRLGFMLGQPSLDRGESRLKKPAVSVELIDMDSLV